MFNYLKSILDGDNIVVSKGVADMDGAPCVGVERVTAVSPQYIWTDEGNIYHRSDGRELGKESRKDFGILDPEATFEAKWSLLQGKLEEAFESVDAFYSMV